MKRLWLVLAFAMTFPSVMAWAYFVVLARPQGSEPSDAVRLAFAAGKGVQFALPLLWVWWIDRHYPRLARHSLEGMVAGAAFGLIVGVAVLLLYFMLLQGSSLLEGAPETIRAKVAEFGLSTPAAYLAFAGFLAVVHSLLEEYYWRWFIFGRLRERVRWPVAVVVSSLAFMAHHVIIVATFFPGRFLTLALPLSLGVAVGGGFWAWLYDRTGSLYPAWLSHFLVDTAILAVGYTMVFGM